MTEPSNLIIQIAPCSIHAFDQFDFLFSGTGLDLFFPGDRIVGICKYFIVDQLVDVIAGCKRVSVSLLMFIHSTLQIVSHPGVEDRIALVRQDVHVELSTHVLAQKSERLVIARDEVSKQSLSRVPDCFVAEKRSSQ